MPVLYLTEQGATVRKEGATFVVTKAGQTLLTIPAIKVEEVVVFGQIHLTTPVINYLLEAGIDCVFCSASGRYHGRLVSNESRFGQLRLQQMAGVTNNSFRLAIAREMVRGKLTNQRTLLMRFQRDRKLAELAQAVERLQQLIHDLERCVNVGQLLGVEGTGSGVYYGAFKRLLHQDLGFTTRARRPPPDPVNSLLSLGYTLLVYDLQAAVRRVGLDPFLGFLHAVAYSRPSLALDLMEEFRPIVVDSVVLRAINTRALKPEDFHRPQDNPRAVLLTDQGRRTFLRLYEERVETRVVHPRTRQQVTYRRCFELQVRHLAQVLQGKSNAYTPFLVK